MNRLSSIPLKQRDQYLIISSLAALVALAWAYLLILNLNMRDMPGMVSGIHPWTSTDFVMMFLMWGGVLAYRILYLTAGIPRLPVAHPDKR